MSSQGEMRLTVEGRSFDEETSCACARYNCRPVQARGYAPVQRLMKCCVSEPSLQVYATSLSMIVTTVTSMVLFDLRPSLNLYLGILTASISLSLYYTPPSMLLSTEGPRKKGPLLPLTAAEKDTDAQS